MISQHALSERRACLLVSLSRHAYRRNVVDRATRDEPLKTRLTELAEHYIHYGYRMLYRLIRREGHLVNHKRVYRVYHEANLTFRRKKRKRLPVGERRPLAVPVKPLECWSLDFMSDSLVSGQRFRLLNIIDDFNREAIHIEVGTSLPSARVIRVLEQLQDYHGLPKRLRMDNGPEFRSTVLAEWAQKHNVELLFIQPGKPTQNAFIERFNGTCRKECLDPNDFVSTEYTRQCINEWMTEYNEFRPHDSLGGIPPREFSNKYKNSLLMSGTTNGG